MYTQRVLFALIERRDPHWFSKKRRKKTQGKQIQRTVYRTVTLHYADITWCKLWLVYENMSYLKSNICCILNQIFMSSNQILPQSVRQSLFRINIWVVWHSGKKNDQCSVMLHLPPKIKQTIGTNYALQFMIHTSELGKMDIIGTWTSWIFHIQNHVHVYIISNYVLYSIYEI